MVVAVKGFGMYCREFMDEYSRMSEASVAILPRQARASIAENGDRISKLFWSCSKGRFCHNHSCVFAYGWKAGEEAESEGDIVLREVKP